MTGDDGAITITAYDANNVEMENTTYIPGSATTARAVLAELCDQAGVRFSGEVPSLTIAGMPTGLTCSAALSHLAALCGANACMNREGYLVFRPFAATGQTLGTDDCYSGGMVFKTSDFTVASLSNTLEVETTDEDGETVTETVEVERTTGDTGGSIALTNPLMTESSIDTAWSVIEGFTYRPATLTAIGQIAADTGDVLTVTDASGTAYSVPIMVHILDYDGGLKSTITAAGESESQQSAAVTGPVAQQINELTSKVAGVTAVANGKTTTYYADEAPDGTDYTVNDIWFDTSDGYAMYYWDGSEWVSAPFGTNALGEGIITTELLAANAVTAGKISVSDLSAISASLGTITGGSIDIGDGSFTVDSDGSLTAQNADISGKITATSGTIGGWTVTDDVMAAEITLDDVNYRIGMPVLDDNGSLLYVWGIYNQSADEYSFGVTADGTVDCDQLTSGTSISCSGTVTGKQGCFNEVTCYYGLTVGANLVVEGAASVEGGLTVNGILYVPSRGIAIANGYGVYHYLSDGSNYARFEYLNSSDQFILGRTGYATYLYGSSITANKSITVSSDRRLKQDIRPLDGQDTGLVDLLAPVAYRLKDDPDLLHYGLVAQDVEEALAELGISDSALVQTNAATGMKSIAYEELIPLLADEIRKLKKTVDKLQKEVCK